MSDEFNWDDALGSGFLDRYIGTVTNASFGIDEDYRDDTVRFMADIELVDTLDDPDANNEPGDVFSEAFNVGKAETWEAVEGGKSVAKVDGGRAKFNNNSGYGQLLALALGKSIRTEDGPQSMDDADKLKEILRGRGAATDAAIWNGLTFEFSRLTFSFKDEDKETVTYERTYPVRFVGEADVSGEG